MQVQLAQQERVLSDSVEELRRHSVYLLYLLY
jgi:hypothetical protein